MDTKQRWERYARDLIRALGHDQLPTAPAATCCQMLMCPAFHAASCFTLALGADGGELCLSILRGSHVDAVERVARGGDQSAKQPCLDAIVALDGAESGELQRRLAACQPGLLDDRLLAARDGIFVRCSYADSRIARTIHMSSPSAAEAPQQLRLIEILLSAAATHIQDPAMRDYLATLERYFR